MNLLFEHAQLQRRQHLLQQIYQARLYALRWGGGWTLHLF